MADDFTPTQRVTIRKPDNFLELYADSGTPEALAPRTVAGKPFKAADGMTDDELEAVRRFDRERGGYDNE